MITILVAADQIYIFPEDEVRRCETAVGDGQIVVLTGLEAGSLHTLTGVIEKHDRSSWRVTVLGRETVWL